MAQAWGLPEEAGPRECAPVAGHPWDLEEWGDLVDSGDLVEPDEAQGPGPGAVDSLEGCRCGAGADS